MAKQQFDDPLLNMRASEIMIPKQARSKGALANLSNEEKEFLNRKINANLSRAASFKQGDVVEFYKLDPPAGIEKYPPIAYGQKVSCADGEFEATKIVPTGTGKKLKYEEDGKEIVFFVRVVSFKTPWGARSINQCTWWY